MTFKEQFIASAAIREKPFEVIFNGSALKGIVRIHPARKYREIIDELSEKGLSVLQEQFLNAEDRTPMFSGQEMDELLPDAIICDLYAEFVKANTGSDPRKNKKGE